MWQVRGLHSLQPTTGRAIRRINALSRQVGNGSGLFSTPLYLSVKHASGTSSADDKVTIGDVTHDVKRNAARQELVPFMYGTRDHNSQEMLHHLRWMMQKHKLKQDIFLVGPPGPERRWLTMRFAELLNLETEYLCITRDTTEADLKQRREIINGNIVYVDQCPVNAALHGRLLVIEGIEKAERNVLPTLNNLLENREMSLEDGRFLVSTERYDTLLERFSESHMKDKKLVRVHPDFRVIAIGLPVPRFQGYPLDPPLRSRFQARVVDSISLHSKLESLNDVYGDANGTLASVFQALTSFRETIKVFASDPTRFGGRVPGITDSAISHLAELTRLLGPDVLCDDIIHRVFPFHLVCDDAQTSAIISALRRFKIEASDSAPLTHHIWPVEPSSASAATSGLLPACSARREAASRLYNVELRDVSARGASGSASSTRVFQAYGGSHDRAASADTIAEVEYKPFVETPVHAQLVCSLMQDHIVGRDMCVVGDKGCGKSALIRHFASQLGYRVRSIQLFKDMTSRDLLQRRMTDDAGNTRWENTTLVEAAIAGDLAILDGVDRLPVSTLVALRTLISDRDLVLFDGTRLLSCERFEALVAKHGSEEYVRKTLNIHPISPSFRIIAVGVTPTKRTPWLDDEVMSLFAFHVIPDLTHTLKTSILHSLFPHVSKSALDSLLDVSDRLNSLSEGDHSAASAQLALSLRQLIRIVRRFQSYPHDQLDTVHRAIMTKFMPTSVRANVEKAVGVSSNPEYGIEKPYENLKIDIDPKRERLTIGDVSMPINKPRSPELVPQILFYDIPKHIHLLSQMMKDFTVGESHLLLIGNQGVGKNKLADRLLELLRLEREYMQLHRDTTVQALTLTPTLIDGRIRYEDSPLVRAVKYGHVLVIDEADKAPVEVVSVLKGLVEDGEMVLSDGRRLIHAPSPSHSSSSSPSPSSLESQREEQSGDIYVHPDFRMIVLANRPGFPFLGNDFFRECGDVFSTHVITNPDRDSEMQLLRSYGPDVPSVVLEKLIDTFSSLRNLVEDGVFAYPYSTRELVAIVKHMQKYPDDGLITSLENVLSFDVYDEKVVNNLHSVFHRHDIPLDLRRRSGQMDVERRKPTVELAKPLVLKAPTVSGQWRVNPGSAVSANRTSASSHTNDINSTPYRRVSTLSGHAPVRRVSVTSSQKNNNTSSLPTSLSQHQPLNCQATRNIVTTSVVACNAVNGELTSASAAEEVSEEELKPTMRVNTMKVRKFNLDVGTLYSVDEWNQGRFDRFTEEKLSFRVPHNIRARSLGMVSLPDDSLHVVTNSPLTLYSFSKGSAYRKYSMIQLEDYLPLYQVDEDSLRIVALPSLNSILVHAASHNIALIVNTSAVLLPDTDPNHSMTAEVSVATVPIAGGRNVRGAKTMIEYLSPGFKMPKYLLQPEEKEKMEGMAALRVVESLAEENLVIMYQPLMHAFTVLSFDLHSTLDIVVDFEIVSVLPISPETWIVESLSGAKYLLEGVKEYMKRRDAGNNRQQALVLRRISTASDSVLHEKSWKVGGGNTQAGVYILCVCVMLPSFLFSHSFSLFPLLSSLLLSL